MVRLVSYCVFEVSPTAPYRNVSHGKKSLLMDGGHQILLVGLGGGGNHPVPPRIFYWFNPKAINLAFAPLQKEPPLCTYADCSCPQKMSRFHAANYFMKNTIVKNYILVKFSSNRSFSDSSMKGVYTEFWIDSLRCQIYIY